MRIPFGDPGPCPVCDTPHTACVPPGYTGPAYITHLPNRDRVRRVTAPQPPPTAAPTAVPVTSMRERRKQRMGG